MKKEDFSLFLFYRDVQTSDAYFDAGVDGVIVDLESARKANRQRGFDTEINQHSVADLRALRKITDRHILCRISGPDAGPAEIAGVIEAGVNEIIVPMLTSERQAERICRLTQDACAVTLMVETRAAAESIRKISDLPVARIYVGLNDLRISRQTASIFTPMGDGLLEQLRSATTGPAFGFGGLTVPGKGAPLPVAHLYHEMARLGAGFTFLRRSFYRDTQHMTPDVALARIRCELAAARLRSVSRVQTDHAAMLAAVAHLSKVPGYD